MAGKSWLGQRDKGEMGQADQLYKEKWGWGKQSGLEAQQLLPQSLGKAEV